MVQGDCLESLELSDGGASCSGDSPMPEGSPSDHPVAARDEDSAGICHICMENLLPGPTVRTAEPVVSLTCGHTFHGFRCLATHIKHKCSEAEERIKSFLEQRFAELELSEEERQRMRLERSFVAMRTRGQLRQCPVATCGYGPVLNTNCANMDAHDAARGTGTGRTTNSCPTCGFHSRSWDDWAPWDPEDLCASARCPVCRASCRIAEVEDSRLQAWFQAEHQNSGSGKVLGAFLRYLFDSILELRSSVRSASHQEFQVFSELSSWPRQVVEARLPVILDLVRSRLTIAERLERERSPGQSSERQEVGTEVATAKLEDLLSEAMSEVSRLMPAEQKYWRQEKSSQKDFMLLMALSEHLVQQLNAAICPIAAKRPHFSDTLSRRFKWRSNSFQDIPNLDSLFEWLKLEQESWMSTKPTTSECSTQTEMSGDAIGLEQLDQQILDSARTCADIEGLRAGDVADHTQALAMLLYPVRDRMPQKLASRLGRPWAGERGHMLEPDSVGARTHVVLRELDRLHSEMRDRAQVFERFRLREELHVMMQLGHLTRDLGMLPAERETEMFEQFAHMREIMLGSGLDATTQVKHSCLNFVSFLVLECAKAWMQEKGM